MAKKRKNTKGGRSGGSNNEHGASTVGRKTRGSNKPSRQRKGSNRGDYSKFAAQEDQRLRDQIEDEGNMWIVDMNPDGNCLFRALSDQLYQDIGGQHDAIRNEVCDFMEENPDDFRVFLVLEGDGDNYDVDGEEVSDFESYLLAMREDGQWGGNLELVAAARVYGRKITVFSASMAAFTIDHGHKEPDGPDLLLSFHDNDHYNSVRLKFSTPISPPPAKGRRANGTVSTKATKKSEKKKQKQPNDDDISWAEMELEEGEKSEEESPANVEEKEPPQAENIPATVAAAAPAKGNSGRPCTKNSLCPCGSKLRYKKCCLIQEKARKRLQSKMNGATSDAKDDGYTTDGTIELKGNFRVMEI